MSYYIKIQDWMLDYELTKNELLILAYIDSFSMTFNSVRWLSKQKICCQVKISERTFYSAIKKLRKLNLVKLIIIEKSSFYVSTTFKASEELLCQKN